MKMSNCMHKIVVRLIVLFFIITKACSANAENVSLQTAQRAAQSFLNSKMGGNPMIHLLDFAEKTELPNLYVFGNERCFVIIAGDDSMHPVLGYSIENAFGEDEMPEEVLAWLMRYDDVIVYLSETRPETSLDIQAEWDCLLSGRGLEPKIRTRVLPLVKTKWSHKKPPFNDLCPADTAGPGGHARGGCGSGAMSQLMNYWEHPVRGIGYFSYSPEQLNHQCPQYGQQYANFGETVYDWDHMKNVYALGYNETEGLAVATLIYHCAVSLQMNFGPQNSYTDPARIATALKTYFDYSQSTNYKEKSNYSDAEWKTMLKDDLDLGRPVVYRGRDATNHLGHIFICDGYDENEYFHFNFDWAGNYDGYYTIGNIDINGTDYDHFNTAIFDCYPNPTSINPPVNVNATVTNRNVTITWTSVSNVSYYKLYRDEDLIANDLHSTNYTDNNVSYGTHFYYVKSVKTDGTMSLRSVSVSADVHFTGPTPTNLQTSVTGYNVNLSWQGENPENAILQYANGSCTGSGGVNTEGSRTNWAQRFPVSMLQDYMGMAIEKVSFYARKTGDYTVGIYKGDVMNTNELVCEQSLSATAGSWYDIVFTTPVALDCTQDLWIVFNSYAYKPASYCSYSGPYHDDALLYSNTQSGVLVWQRLTDNKAWLMKTYLTDGTYTYNLYRNDEAVVTNLINNTYTDSNLTDGFYDYHVTTNYFGGESDPSNTVNLMVGNPTYSINVSANPSNGGSVTGGGTYNYNQSCTVTATPNTGCAFVNWTENGTVVSSDASYTFTVTENRYLVAHFQMQSYTISISADPNNGGTVTGGGTYNYGQTCTLTATPATGYEFVNWTKNGTQVSTSANYSFTVTESAAYVAHFQFQSFTITATAAPSDGGTVAGGGAYNYGQTCTLTAMPSTGYEFVNWTKNGTQVSTNANYSFAVTESAAYVAHFQFQSFTITATADPNDGGMVAGGGAYNYGQTCVLSATPAIGYEFVNWTKNGTQVSANANYSFTVTESAAYVAHFQLQIYTISVSANPSNGGTATGGGVFHYGDVCSVIATANAGFNFVNWTESGNPCCNNQTYSFTVTSNRTLVANFTTQNYVITALAEPIEGGTITGAGGYNYGESCTLTAIENMGYNFLRWTKNGAEVSQNSNYTFIVSESATYIAHFTAQDYTVTVASNPVEGGTVSGGGTYSYGQTCTVHASVNSCYTFDNWTENGNVVSNQLDYSFVVTSNRNLIANLSKETYEITAEVNPIDGGSVIGTGTYQCGEMVTLTAEPNENYSFLNWTENGNIVSLESIMQFEANEIRHLTANFSYYDGVGERVMPIEIYPNPANEILTIRGEGIYRVMVFNMAGQVVEDREVHGQEQIQIDVHGYRVASYFMHILTEDGWSVRRFVKE